MDPQSPPKRMTRARAAAKTSDPTTKATRIMTAAAKAKTARSTSTSTTTTATTTTRTATKRKAPPDETDDEDHDELEPSQKNSAASTKPTRGRGRPKKVAIAEPAPAPEPAPVVRTRGRPKKVVEPVAEEPAKTTRTSRVKKAAPEDTNGNPEPVKKTTRTRPAMSATASTTAKSLGKPVVKKTVKFEEPEKENIVPVRAAASRASTKASAPAAGLRGKPVRKAASTTGRAARSTKAAAGTASQNEKEEKPMPLSPKKVNQLALNRVESDDELGMDEKVPVVRLKKLPIKPAPGNTKSSATKTPASALVSENDENVVPVSRAETELNLMLGTPAKRLPPSPWKGSMRSPARRVEGLFSASAIEVNGQTSQAPTRMGLLQTPAKRQPLALNLGVDSLSGAQGGVSPLKMSFLSSPAKRPISPIKPLPRTIEEEPEYQSPAPKPTLLASPLPRHVSESLRNIDATADEDMMIGHSDDEDLLESPSRFNFPGRLSAVLPRHADPALTPPTLSLPKEAAHNEVEDIPAEEAAEEAAEFEGEPMVLDSTPIDHEVDESTSTTPTSSPPKMANPMFGLREKDLDLYDDAADSESDDESPTRRGKFTSAFTALPATPCRASAGTPSRRKSCGRSTAKRARVDGGFGFTPLAQQLSGWTAGPSPLKTCIGAASPSPVPAGHAQEELSLQMNGAALNSAETTQNTFFEDEMLVRPHDIDVEVEVEGEPAGEPEETISPVLEDVPFSEEDMELAAEANEMSLLETEQPDANNQGHDDTLSEASQEYGDENAAPIEPTLAPRNDARASSLPPSLPPVTPQRVLRREVHTVAKVPLKAADDSTPRPQSDRRTRSSARLPVVRSAMNWTKNAPVTSDSPTKGADADTIEEREEEHTESAPLVTPQKSDIWSTIGTPARTPRRDLNPGLLRGAMVFADVHTSDGADASGIFVELLTQMGARCVKNWSWNPSQTESGADSKIGITHVVYKDGGKRTLEKVRESGGVVQCVGVSWVLDCERENQWLDEAPYAIDTAVVPRGGARRRKSMEPRAIANLNGMLVPSPVRSNKSGSQTPSTPSSNRRASALWIRTPEEPRADDNADNSGSDNSDHDDEVEVEWAAPLTPVPKTPAPEAIARFAANISPGAESTTSVGSLDSEDPLDRDDDDQLERDRQAMLMRTCPPKRTTFVEPGQGLLMGKEKDERILMRLMAARRKSLQFAPKIGSPLARTWKAWN